MRSGERQGAFLCNLLQHTLLLVYGHLLGGRMIPPCPALPAVAAQQHRLGMCCSSLLNTPSSTPLSAVPFDSPIPVVQQEREVTDVQGIKIAAEERTLELEFPGRGLEGEQEH